MGLVCMGGEDLVLVLELDSDLAVGVEGLEGEADIISMAL